MKIVQWDTTNFGDCLNDLIWPHFLPSYELLHPQALLYGIGSLINHRIPADLDKYFFGSGFGHGQFPNIDDRYKFVWVRGPRTAALIKQRAGIQPDFVSDGALLLKRIYTAPVNKTYDLSFIPHCSVATGGLKDRLTEACCNLGIHYIDVERNRDSVIHEIRASRRIMTEALHGAIVSDAFSIPWIPLSRPGIFEFKWLDYCETVNRCYSPCELPYKPSLFNFSGLKGALKQLLSEVVISQISKKLKLFSESTDFTYADPQLIDKLNERMLTKIEEFELPPRN